MNSYALRFVENDLGIDESGLQDTTRPQSSFENFKSLPELVLNEEEWKKYRSSILNRVKRSTEENGISKISDAIRVDEMEVDEEEQKLDKFIKIDQLKMDSFKDEIFTMTIINVDKFISESKFKIEKYLDIICELLGIKRYKWSWLEGEIELTPIYIKLFKLNDFVRFVNLYKELDSKFGQVQLESNVEQLQKDYSDALKVSVDTTTIDEYYNEVHSHHLQNVSKSRDGDIYSEYQVDPKELVDVPKDLIDIVKNDIVEFRLRVLKLEKLKREKDAINDKKKSRYKMKKLYQDISKTNTFDDYEDKEDDFSQGNGEDDEDELNDSDIEQAQQEKLDQLSENEFQVRLKIIKDQDLNRLKLVKAYKMLKDYDTTLKQKSGKFIKDFVEIESVNNKIDNNLDKFYLNHSNYLKFRNKVRQKEELQDQETKSILTYINELILEFVGIEDESLSGFIMRLVNENYPNKVKVIEPLRETLDEDAETFVNKLWEFINV